MTGPNTNEQQLSRQIAPGVSVSTDGSNEPTDADLLAIGREAYSDHKARRAADEKANQFHTLVHDIRRLYRGWEDNSIVREQPFSVTLNETKTKVLIDGLDRLLGHMGMGQAVGMNPVDRALNRRQIAERAYGDNPVPLAPRPLGATPQG